MDGMIAIAVPVWVVWVFLGLGCCIIAMQVWRICLMLDERKSRRATLTIARMLVRRQRVEELGEIAQKTPVNLRVL